VRGLGTRLAKSRLASPPGSREAASGCSVWALIGILTQQPVARSEQKALANTSGILHNPPTTQVPG
jgi:hypothetical protein